MKIAALAGGVGGAKLADGLARVLTPEELTVIVNTGDDFEFLGLKICPDLDTVCYTLAGIANSETGWGRSNESFYALESLTGLGGPGWFKLGDRDLGLHLERTRRFSSGDKLSEMTRDFCQAWGVRVKIFPMSDDPVPTRVLTDLGELPFQEYFVLYRCQPVVRGFKFNDADKAKPAPGVLDAIETADAIILCPSNPWVSIDPILSIPGIRSSIESKSVFAVSPIIGGHTIKGPAAKMFSELGIEPSALAVCSHYKELLAGFVIDEQDSHLRRSIEELGITVRVTNTIMHSDRDRTELADKVLHFCGEVG